jgi:hypothetical protein
MRKLILGAAMAAVALPMPAMARPRHHHGERQYHGRHYSGPIWEGRDGRVHCRRSNGTTGLIIGAAGGALLGRAVDTHGERTTGTVLGAAVGALLGREATQKVRCR